MWIIVEINRSHPEHIGAYGPFDSEHAAEMKRRERYFERYRDDGSWMTDHYFYSYVREVKAP